MYPVGNDYIQANNSNNRDTKITGTIKPNTGAVIRLDSDSFKKLPNINNQCSGDDELILGQAYQGELSFEFYTNADRYMMLDAEVTLSKFLRVNGEWIEVPLGTYVVTDCVRSGLDGLKITALDDMSKLDKECPKGTVTNGYPYELLSLIARNTGILLGQTEAEIQALPNGTVFLGMPILNEAIKYRDIAGDLAACLGGFVTIGRDRKLYIRNFAHAPCRTITADYRGKDTVSDYKIRYTAVTCVKNGTKKTVGTTIGNSIDLGDNLFLQLGTDENTYAVLNSILDEYDGYTFVPATIEYKMDDPTIELGDLINVTGYTAEQGIAVPVHKYDWTWRGVQRITSVGKDPKRDTKSKIEKQIDSLQNKENKDKVSIVSYINSSDYAIGNSWTRIAKLRIGVMNSQIVLLNGIVKLNLTEAGTVRVRYEINSSYDPFIHVVQYPTGENVITAFLPISLTNEYVNEIGIEIQSDDAIGDILVGDVQFTLQGVGVTTGNWDGYIEIEDEYSFPFQKGLGFNYEDEAEVVTSNAFLPITARDTAAFPLQAGLAFGYTETANTRITMEGRVRRLITEDGKHLLTEDGKNIIMED